MTADPAPPLRVLVAEPAVLIAAVLAHAVAGVATATVFAGDVRQLEAAADSAGVDVVLVGPGFALAGLVQVIPRLVARQIRTVIVSAGPLDRGTSTLLLVGASGLLPYADTSLTELADAVRRVAAGASALHPDVVHAVLLEWRRQRSASAPEVDERANVGSSIRAGKVTGRELEVLQGLRDGLTTRLIAARLGVAEKTVEAHKSRLFAKLGARNQSQAVQAGSERGLI